MPKLSVVMPVYNGEKFVIESVQSILNQNYIDFEFIIIDDRSHDNTVSVVQSIKDDRIKLYINDRNKGRAGSDNVALKYVQGEYIAKMDSDDICHPERFARQINYLEQHPEVNVVGSWMQNFGSSNYLNKYPENPKSARCFTLFGLPVGNPSIMLRSELFTKQGMHYDESLRQTEDFDFFARYADNLVVATLPEALINYRTYPDIAKKSILDERGEVSHQVRENFLKAWGIPFNKKEANIHHALAHSNAELADSASLKEYQEWLLKLYNYNLENPFFDQESLQQLLADKWFHLCYLNPGRMFAGYFSYQNSHFKKFYSIPLSLKFKFLVKAITNFF